MPARPSQRRIRWAMNSGPLSLRRYCGAPRRTTSCASTGRTRSPGSRSPRAGAAGPTCAGPRRGDGPRPGAAARPPGPHRAPAAGPHNPEPSAPRLPAHTPAGRTAGGSARSVPERGGPLRAPFFCVDLFQHLELELPVGEQPLQAGILALQPLEPDGLGLGEAAVLLAPPIEGVAGGTLTPDEARDRLPTQLLLAQQADDLLLVKSADPHRTPPLGHPVAYVSYPLVRKTGGRPRRLRPCRI